ncbi:CHASE2 domain-containing protein [Argonema antarcticum]|uniref:CHASE2 domain-containing protein n=1 Tax=Argonema antarcticum TaxID=2942763 RepID=UPI002012D4B8|nr:CHASE2 domain-containing protein [Argonema antarcticum]
MLTKKVQIMVKLVVLKLDGDLERNGFRVSLEIGWESRRPEIEIAGQLPPDPDLLVCLERWQQNYRSVGAPYRIKPKKITYDGSVNKRIEQCHQSAQELRLRLSAWLDSEDFRPIDRRLREELSREEAIRLLIRTEDSHLQKLPWHLWDFFERYPLAEVALSAKKFEATKKSNSVQEKPRVKILAILGHSAGLDIERDRGLLESLPNAEVVFLVEPQRQQINDRLWEQPWDIIFFAGHSETEGETGIIYINSTESLTINELWYALRKAVEQGLKLALFNSCDGLGLARQLDDLHIPQMIVMRELVPDRVAQEFLRNFLTAFVAGKSFYLAVREARERLQGMEGEFPCATWLPVICQNPAEVPPSWEDLLPAAKVEIPSLQKIENPNSKIQNWQSVLLASVVVTALVTGERSLGFLQAWELQSFDGLMRSRPDEGQDNRLLLVTITENDVQSQPSAERGSASISDRSLAILLKKVEQYQPRAIGLLIYRDNPVQPKYADLATRMKKSDRFFAVCQASNGNHPGILPPAEVPLQRLGFNNLITDPDGILRRHLLANGKQSPCQTEFSLSLQLAKRYLDDDNIKFDLIKPEDYLSFIGKTIFTTLEKDSGGYQQIDSRAHQIMLNYRSTRQIAPKVTLKELINGQINPDLVKNRIVIIGTTAPSFNDDHWLTPYSYGHWPIQRMTGVEIQAHKVSQILSAVLDNRPLIWWWSKQAETIWIWCWSLVGGMIGWCLRSRIQQIAAGGITIFIIYGICFSFLLKGGWIPLIPSVLALVITGVSLAMYTLSTNRQQ